MVTYLSKLFVRTLRQDPAAAEVPSHKWLVRAGYIRRVAPGIYSWLPLGLKVLRNVEKVVREEMGAIGAQEVLLPALLPKEPYETSNRWTEYGDNLFRLVDRKGSDMLLGPTHEEMFTSLVKDLYSSYKDLPLIIYQIQNKYRDEARPRAGILRGREFVMKDSYSFDIDDSGLQNSYDLHRQAYIRIFDRLGFDYVIVNAMAGAMGGSSSEEFLAIAKNGEDTFVVSPGGFAANVEAIQRPRIAPVDFSDAPAAHVEDTPNAGTIESLVQLANQDYPRNDRPWNGADTLKNVLFMLNYPSGVKEPLAIGLPGDREVDMKRLEAAFEPVVPGPFEEADFENFPELVKGYIGPQQLGQDENGEGIKYLVDPTVGVGTRWITGANEAGKHVFDLVCGRDFTPDGVLDVSELKEGDLAPDGSGPLTLARGIELGHIFQLGRKYADSLGLKVLDQNGKQVVVTMGSYGIGISRAVAAIAEATCDEKGLSWPIGLAPFQVQVLAAGRDEAIFQTAEELARTLEQQGIEVLVDDRKASPGVKFADAEVLGMPISIVVGRGLTDGLVEVRTRNTADSVEVPVAQAVETVVELIKFLESK